MRAQLHLIVSSIIPRLLFLGFTFAQPFLINATIEHVGSSPDATSTAQGYGLIGATALIYVGIAVGQL